jgi:hypothetical protein
MNAFKDMLSDDPATGWPDPVTVKGSTYKTPDGNFPRVTSVLKAYGGGTEGLISWSAKVERAACLEACAEVYAVGVEGGPAEFAAAVESRLGAARAHQKLLVKAGDIGTSIHNMIQWTLRAEMGEDPGLKPTLSDPAELAFMSWSDWWKSKGLRAVRVEQPVWDAGLGYAGTVDLIAEGPAGLELWDWKSSAGVYETHHIQAAAYIHACQRWAPVSPGGIVHLPKSINDKLEATEHTIGKMYGGRTMTQEEMVLAFRACLGLYNMLLKPVGKD